MTHEQHNRKAFNRLLEDLPEMEAGKPLPQGMVHDNDCIIFKRGEHLFILGINENDQLLLSYE